MDYRQYSLRDFENNGQPITQRARDFFLYSSYMAENRQNNYRLALESGTGSSIVLHQTNDFGKKGFYWIRVKRLFRFFPTSESGGGWKCRSAQIRSRFWCLSIDWRTFGDTSTFRTKNRCFLRARGCNNIHLWVWYQCGGIECTIGTIRFGNT